MASLTQGDVEGLLKLLASTIKDEYKLLGGVEGDILFIRDEMDSMNGFLLHLSKMEAEHNDQHRAWMKQVRDIAYLAHNCIELYRRDLTPPGTRWWQPSNLRQLPMQLRTWPTRRRLAKQLHELKDRVREVGERRQRYGVSVPDAATPKPAYTVVRKDRNADKEREEKLTFLRALEEDASLEKALSILTDADGDAPLLSEAAVQEVREILAKCKHRDSKRMLLCAVYAYPHVTKKELSNLNNKLTTTEGGGAVDVSKEVMLLSYSKLSTHYKSCLLYLTAFLDEESISRTVLIRRWVAEGLVARDEKPETVEAAGERCFDELVFRGFVRPATPVVPCLKIKSCCMEGPVKEFVIDISQSENFISTELPDHLDNQVRIRKIAQRPWPPATTTKAEAAASPPPPRRPWNICPRKLLQDSTRGEDKQQQLPMDELVGFLRNLPEEYRLNVLDLGGCKSPIRNRHLKSFCKVLSLKYLSLRRTDVSQLPKEINDLRQLETLDVRQTRITTVDRIDLPNLKRLLAGDNETGGAKPWAVQMPKKRMAPTMEILRHVRVPDGDAASDLPEKVGRLKQLRKFGVVLINSSEDGIRNLLRTITMLATEQQPCLRSLSVCICNAASKDIALEGTEADSCPKELESLNIKYFGPSSGSILPLPSWIREFKKLSKITLSGVQVTRDTLKNLGNLESLCCLRLHGGSYTEDCVYMDDEQFQNLRFLLVANCNLFFDIKGSGASNLEKITWVLHGGEAKITENTLGGISKGHLQNLKEVELRGDESMWSNQQLDGALKTLSADGILVNKNCIDGSSGHSHRLVPVTQQYNQ